MFKIDNPIKVLEALKSSFSPKSVNLKVGTMFAKLLNSTQLRTFCQIEENSFETNLAISISTTAQSDLSFTHH